jgi:hypothetical protein
MSLELARWPLRVAAYRLSSPQGAVRVYGQLLSEVPHDQRVQEGLQLAAAGTGDATQLSQVWQQVLAFVDGYPDIEVRALFQRVSSEVRGRRLSAAGATGTR